jgi:hypothetical protein
MDDDPAIGNPHLFSHLRDSAKLLLNETADRDGFIAEIDFQKIVDLANFGPAVNKDMVLP